MLCGLGGFGAALLTHFTAPSTTVVAVQHAIVLYLVGDISGSATEVRRALALDPAEPTALRLREILFAG